MSYAPAITIRNAYLRYHNQILFDYISLQLPANKTTCLLGPSGVGKTSLLRMLAGLPINNGTLQKAEITADDHLPLQNRISYLAQTDLLLPWLTTLENALLGYRLRKSKNADIYARAKNLLTNIGLAQALQKYPAQLSGGMRQRVALARTLLEDQPILLMDEPFSALDTITRLQLQELTAERVINKTVLLITHDPLEALRLGHQIIVMAGRPAVFSKIFSLNSNTPRALTDSQLLQKQGELMEFLAHAKEAML
jgi:putative hydroxymethylpyrimidine transport system ATP-binding protein